MAKLDFLLAATGAVIRDRAASVLLLAGLAALAAGGLAAAADKPPLKGDMKDFVLAEPAKPLPAMAFTDLDGKELSLDAFKGRVVVLNLWATWCVPCIKEMPSLERLAAKMKDRPVAVMSISQDRGGAKQVTPFLEKQGLKTLPIYLDPKGVVLKAINGRGLPTTLIVDQQGREVGRLEGDAEWDGANALALIEHVLAQGADNRPALLKTGG
ncbi:MAG: TlpA family protein disulfide reductase [Alphaproteobacteria bacterium]|nr:TlpA family protein disulfide reductase [Alphaproteobacteria bacterium]